MWNPFKLRSHEARQLELRIIEIEDELGKLIGLFGRIDARLRKRASVATEQPEPSARADGGGGDAHPDIRSDSSAVMDGYTGPVFTKEQLRQFAKQRGLMG